MDDRIIERTESAHFVSKGENWIVFSVVREFLKGDIQRGRHFEVTVYNKDFKELLCGIRVSHNPLLCNTSELIDALWRFIKSFGSVSMTVQESVTAHLLKRSFGKDIPEESIDWTNQVPMDSVN